jgi:hypothetical protein
MSLLEDTKTEPIEVINKRLLDTYGRFSDDRARFRIVWSEDEVEKAFGFHNVFIGSRFLRQEYGTYERRKYSYIIPSAFILEELEGVNDPDRPGVKSSYEPKWTFVTPDNHPQFPSQALWPAWWAVEFVVKARLEGIKKSVSDLLEEKEKDEKKELTEFEDALGDGGVGDMKNQSVNFVKPVYIGGKDAYRIDTNAE